MNLNPSDTMKHLIIILALSMLIGLKSWAGDSNAIGQEPRLTYVMELKVTCAEPFSCGQTSRGHRVVIPITGGTFEGPNIRGEVLSGGADYQYVDSQAGRTELEAIYCIRTDDGVNIHVRNCGLLCVADGAPYFRTAPRFEAPRDSRYNWLNDAIFVCVPHVADGYISLKVWKVE